MTPQASPVHEDDHDQVPLSHELRRPEPSGRPQATSCSLGLRDRAADDRRRWSESEEKEDLEACQKDASLNQGRL